MIQIRGKGGIEVKIIADSISEKGDRLTTLHCTYHRFIHPEVLTHRVFSRNSRSSRAVPTNKLIKEINENPALPIYWGKNKSGMQASEELSYAKSSECAQEWMDAAKDAMFHSNFMKENDLHKEEANRILEPYIFIDTLITSTEWSNFFELRISEYAQPEIRELARCIKEAIDISTPNELEPGYWHLPYILEDDPCWLNNTYEELRMISAARCARISYRPFDGSEINTEKDLELAKRLIRDKHYSPTEHQGTPIEDNEDFPYEEGVTHLDRYGNLHSNNFKGWVQFRSLL